MGKPRVVFVVGTRPDAIKTAPVVNEFLGYPGQVETVLISTGQHREMLQQALDAFGLQPDRDLAVMRHGQSLADVTGRALDGLDDAFEDLRPDMVFAQGDTTTTFVAGLTAFYRHIPFGHVEAGLRTDTIWDPFPEEFNRRAVGLFAAQHYAPTPLSAENLIRERVAEKDIFITGNTGIDAVQAVARQRQQTWFPDHNGRILLLTTHRRENWGLPQQRIAEAVREVLRRHEDALLVVSMHRNPKVRETLKSVLGNEPRVQMIEPPEYAEFVKLMERCDLIFSDSGGVQEEAPAFGKPVLVLRRTTERPEGVSAGVALLVGTDKGRIIEEGCRLLDDPEAYRAMAHAASPYGDGRAAARVRYAALKHLGVETPEEKMWACSKR